MNKKTLNAMWDHVRQLNGITMRCVEALPGDTLDSNPIPKMRTPKELVAHMYLVLKNSAEGVVSGTIAETDDISALPRITNKQELLAYCRQCWAAADRAVQATTDAQLVSMVETPWDMTFPGFVSFSVIQDEFLHHRGQLYTYLRAMGREVPNMWDFAGNAPEFQPRQEQQA